jgi:dihydroneopterin aldolase
MDNHIFNPPASIPSPENIGETPATQAVVSVRNLQLPLPVIAPNIWHETKEQPALASVSLWLRDSFTSAASQDALDDSTVHYGQLSKLVRSYYEHKDGQVSGARNIISAAEHMASKRKPNGDENFVAKRIAARLTLPKASAFGDELAMSSVRLYNEEGGVAHMYSTFSCKNLRIPTLIGVNAYERKGRQPLVVDFALDIVERIGRTPMDEMETLFPLERDLVDVSLLPPDL